MPIRRANEKGVGNLDLFSLSVIMCKICQFSLLRELHLAQLALKAEELEKKQRLVSLRGTLFCSYQMMNRCSLAALRQISVTQCQLPLDTNQAASSY